jgi:hypothetical protein
MTSSSSSLPSSVRPSAFRSAPGGAVERAGIVGAFVMVRADGNGIELEGAERGRLRIEYKAIERMRVEGYEGRYGTRHFLTRLWFGGNRQPLTLLPMPGENGAYAATIRVITNVLLREGRCGRVWSCSSAREAVFVAALMATVATAFTGLVLLERDDFAGSAAIVLVCGLWLLIGTIICYLLRRDWPRPIQRLADLDPCLPL